MFIVFPSAVVLFNPTGERRELVIPNDHSRANSGL
jgi:hypothetical protein